LRNAFHNFISSLLNLIKTSQPQEKVKVEKEKEVALTEYNVKMIHNGQPFDLTFIQTADEAHGSYAPDSVYHIKSSYINRARFTIGINGLIQGFDGALITQLTIASKLSTKVAKIKYYVEE